MSLVKKTLLLPVCAALLTLALPTLSAHADAEGEITWEPSLETALEKAAAEDKLIFMDIYADWCAPCQMMKKETFHDPAVVKALKSSYVCIMVNSDKDQETAARYGTGALPCLTVLTKDGAAIERTEGFHRPAEFLQFLESAKKRMDELLELEKAVAADPSNTDKAMSLVETHLKMGAAEKALKVLDAIKLPEKENDGGRLRADLGFNRGLALLMADKFPQGIVELEKFIQAFPEEPRRARAESYIERGKALQALEMIEKKDYAPARALLTTLAENAKERQLSEFAKRKLMELDALENAESSAQGK